MRIIRLFWDYVFVVKKNLENFKRLRLFNRMCKGCVFVLFLVFVGIFYFIGEIIIILMVDWIVVWFYFIFYSNYGKFYLWFISI